MGDALEARLAAPGPVHFLGIGGVGMAGLALLLRAEGREVSGSDAEQGPLTAFLRSQGISVNVGHHRDRIPAGVAWAVRTPAVAEDNPELEALRSGQVPVFARGNVLAVWSRARRTLAVAGAHGKTTTTAMLTHMLRACGVDCGYAIGGETVFAGRVAAAGSDPLFVCEADESDGTLAQYAPEIGLLTHVEWDHIERFATEAALLTCYRRFAARCGTLILHADDALAARVAEGHPRVRVVDAERFPVEREDDPKGQSMILSWKGESIRTRLCLPGRHNTRNALLALAAVTELGLDAGTAWRSLERFVSVGRRFDRCRVGGVEVVHDYAHHPTEVRALLESVRALRPRRIFAAFQPHRYSRTRHLLAEFAEAFAGVHRLDLLPVYAASELKQQGKSSLELAERCRTVLGGEAVRHFERAEELAEAVGKELEAGDVFLIVGAGDILKLTGSIQSVLNAKEGVS